MAGAALGAPSQRSAEVWRQALGAASFCVQVQRLEHLRLVLRDRRSTWSTSGSFCVAGAALGAPPAHSAWQVQHWKHLSCVLRGNCLEDHLHSIINTTPATHHHLHNIINATPSPHHHLHSIINTTPPTHHHLHIIIYTASSTHHHPHQHHQHCTISTTYNITPSTKHRLHNVINTTPSTPHHLHNTIYTTPSTQPHLHYIIRCSAWSTAILPLLPHSC